MLACLIAVTCLREMEHVWAKHYCSFFQKYKDEMLLKKKQLQHRKNEEQRTVQKEVRLLMHIQNRKRNCSPRSLSSGTS